MEEREIREKHINWLLSLARVVSGAGGVAPGAPCFRTAGPVGVEQRAVLSKRCRVPGSSPEL